MVLFWVRRVHGRLVSIMCVLSLSSFFPPFQTVLGLRLDWDGGGSLISHST